MRIRHLFTLRILTPARIARLLIHVLRHGIQLGNVVHMCGEKDAMALKHQGRGLTYRALRHTVAAVSGYLYDTYNIQQGSTVLVIVDNSIPSVILLFALSALGCNIQVCAPMQDYDQFRRTVDLSKYDLVFSGVETGYDYYASGSIHHLTPVWHKAISHQGYKPLVRQLTRISIFTSGSTGVAKKAQRRNTLWQYLNVISDLVKTLRLQTYRCVLLPVPIYHSYGLSTLFLSLMLNKTVVLVNRFDPPEVEREIGSNKAEVAVLVPQMLNRLLNADLTGLRCVISCADVLPGPVWQQARNKLGDIIFNLYGTSETGLATIATPVMLAAQPDTIGRPIQGCKLKLYEENGSNILYVASAFAISRGFIRTGDIASKDERGWYYLHGRADDLMVINGTNVYPYELTHMAYGHERVQYAGVKAFINDEGFRKIKMTLVVKPGVAIDEHEFKQWWVSKYGTRWLPAVVEFKTDDSHMKLMRS